MEQLHVFQFTCEACLKNFPTCEELMIHAWNEHVSHQKRKPSKNIVNTKENQPTNKEEKSDKQIKQKHSPIMVKNSFIKRKCLTIKDRNENPDKIGQSRYCGKGFLYKNHFIIHQGTPTVENPKEIFKTSKSGCKDPQSADDKLEASEDKASTASINLDQVNNGEGGITTNAPLPALKHIFECDVCEKMFIYSSRLKRHKLIHTGEKPFKCKHCDKRFSQGSHLAEHERTHTGSKLFKCRHCDKGFVQRNNLTRHKRTHTGEKPFKCKYCDKGFSQRGHLADHERTHTGEKPFMCKHCDKGFSQRGHLTEHERIHTGERPFKCRHCDKRFANRSHLKRHEKTHTGEKPKNHMTLTNKFQ